MESKKVSDYEKYIRTEELLSLQKTNDEACCSEEMTFQVIHQIAELHFKLIIQYIHQTREFIANENLLDAVSHLQRIGIHLKQLPEVFNMVKVISPRDYHTIRLSLGQGSGQDSPGFNEILKLGPTLWEPFEKIMNKQQVDPLSLHKDPSSNRAMFALMQELIQFDEAFQTFRYQHLQLVKRMIGLETNSLKGIPAKVLQRGIVFEFYPLLWKTISELTDYTGSSYNPKPL